MPGPFDVDLLLYGSAAALAVLVGGFVAVVLVERVVSRTLTDWFSHR